jgi:exodeoxyribonuclease VII small subunit
MVDLDFLMASLDQPVEGLTYERAYEQLEQVVSVLESGEYSLEISLTLFERGQALARYCSELLDQAELKVQQVSGESLVDFGASE